MADFRRVVTALAVLVLLTGLAVSANAQAFSCNASAAVPPLLRAEGLTELTGDIVINCTGGTALGAGAAIPRATFTVFVGQTVITSRVGEALLLINDVTAAGGSDAPIVGTVSGNSVTFANVPVIPPAGTALIYRITNVRVNASNIGGGPGGTPGQVNAFISISGSTSVPITNPAPIIGFVKSGLTFDVLGSDLKASTGFTGQQCSTVGFNDAIQGYLSFTEAFGTAFKTRTVADQTTPGAIYNTESGLLVAGAPAATTGTLLRARFANIPTGTTVYVSLSNVDANNAPLGNATLVSGETGTITAVTAATGVTTTPNAIDVAAVTLTSGAGEAVWQVVNSDSTAVETYNFAVAFAISPSPGTNVPATGVQGTVAGSFAPALPTTDTATSTVVPRFVDSNLVKNLISFTICQTRLLFPYAANTDFFDTGIAIANTSKDPFGTTPQAGTCALNFYGTNAPTAAFTTPTIGHGDGQTPVYANSLLGDGTNGLAPGFTGYIIAVCNFQFAHGFAFVSDIGAHNVAMGYLALVIPDGARVPVERLQQ